jgi:DNA-binding PadR family transcriptional regulator
MKRKPNTLLPLELAILGASIEFAMSSDPEYHGYAMAKRLSDHDADRRLTAHGTLYRALERLEKAGMLKSRWEDPEAAGAERRPLRRLYRVTATGEAAHAAAAAGEPVPLARLHRQAAL